MVCPVHRRARGQGAVAEKTERKGAEAQGRKEEKPVFPLCRVEPLSSLRIQYVEAALADGAASRPGTRRVDETTVEMAGADAPWMLL